MDPITQAIYSRLAGDSTLTALLADSVIGSGLKAIYSTVPVPPRAVMPYVVIAPTISDEPDDPAERAAFRDIIRDIHFYAAKPDHGGGSSATVDTMAARGRLLFHQLPLALTDATGAMAKNLECLASGPIGNDGPHAFGRVVTLTLRVRSLVPS